MIVDCKHFCFEFHFVNVVNIRDYADCIRNYLKHALLNQAQLRGVLLLFAQKHNNYVCHISLKLLHEKYFSEGTGAFIGAFIGVSF